MLNTARNDNEEQRHQGQPLRERPLGGRGRRWDGRLATESIAGAAGTAGTAGTASGASRS